MADSTLSMTSAKDGARHDGTTRLPSVGFLIGLALFLVVIEPAISARIARPFEHFDKLLAALALAFLFGKALVVQTLKSTEAFFLIWFLYCVVVSLFFGLNTSAMDVLLQAMNQSKLVLMVLIAAIYLDDRNAKRWVRIAVFATIAGGFLSIALPGAFSLGEGGSRYRFLGLTAPGGFQLHPNRLGRILALIPLLTHHQLGMSRRGFNVVLVLSFLLVIASTSRIALVLFLAIMFLRWMFTLRGVEDRFFILWMVGIPLLIFVGFFGYDALRLGNLGNGLVTGEEAPIFRVILIADAIDIARQHFPIGSGLATFGTPLSLDQDTYNGTMTATTFYFLRGSGLFDTNYASIIGETGLIGTIMVISLLLFVFRRHLAQAPAYARISVPAFVFTSLAFESTMQAGGASAAIALFTRAAMLPPKPA